MLDPSIPWLAPGYRKHLSQGTSSLSASLPSTPTDDFQRGHSTSASRQGRRVRSAIISSRHRLQPTPPVSPEIITPRRPGSASRAAGYRSDCGGLEKPACPPQRPKSALERGRQLGEPGHGTPYRIPRRVKSARHVRHRPSLLQNKSITQVERLHQTRLTVSSIPVGQTMDHKPCAYCPVECRPRSSSSQRPTSSTGLVAADVPSHFDRTKFWSKGTARPRTAPTSRREFLHLPRHNFIRRGTVPHYTHFIKGLSLYPRDGSPLPAPLGTGPTVVVQDVDRSLSSEFGDYDSVGFSPSVLNDSDWEDVEDGDDEETPCDGAVNAINGGDVCIGSVPSQAEALPITVENLVENGTRASPPPTVPTAPFSEREDSVPATDVGPNRDGGRELEGAMDRDGDTDVSLKQGYTTHSPENVIQESSELMSNGEDSSKCPVDTEELGRKLEESLLVNMGDGMADAGETELKPVVKMIPMPAEQSGTDGPQLKKTAMVNDILTKSRKKSEAKKAAKMKESDTSRPVQPGWEDVSGVDERQLRGTECGSRPDGQSLGDKANAGDEAMPGTDLDSEKMFENGEPPIPDILLTVDEPSSDKNDEVSPGMTAVSNPGSGESEDGTGQPGVKLGPRPPKMKVDFMSVDKDTMREILDMEMKLRRREAEEKSPDAVKVQDVPDNKKVFVPSSWNCCRVALSRQAGRFEIPMDTRDLTGLTPVEYLLKYCRVTPQRRALYRRTFSRVDQDKDGKLTRKEVDRAVREALVDTVGDEHVAEVLRSIGADEGDKAMTFQLFAPFCALLERLYYSQFVTEDSSNPDASLRERIEDADFYALEWKLNGYAIRDDLRRLLQSL